MLDLHPALVHFPVALLTFSVCADLAGRLLKNETAATVGWWAQIAGAISIVFSVGSGLLAKGAVTDPLLLSHLDTHEQLAFLAAVVFVTLTFWRFSVRGRIPSYFYFVALVAGLLLVWGTAWYGGELVYRYGLGVRP